jgi:hypothetical protein
MTMRKFLISLFLSLGLSAAASAQTVTNLRIEAQNSNGDFIPITVPSSSAQGGQDITINATTGQPQVNPIIKGNVTSSVIASGSAVSLTTATAKNVTSLTLGVGTWRLYGYVDYVLASATSTLFQQGFGTTTNSFTNSLQAQDTNLLDVSPLTTTSVTLTKATPWQQITVSSGTQTVYMVAEATFSAGTVTAYGSFNALQVK